MPRRRTSPRRMTEAQEPAAARPGSRPRPVRPHDDVVAVVAGEDQGVVGQGQDLLVERAVQVVSKLLGSFGEIRPTDTVDEQRVTRQYETVGDDVDRRTTGVARGVDRRHLERDTARELEAVLFAERLVGELERVGRVQVQVLDPRPRPVGERHSSDQHGGGCRTRGRSATRARRPVGSTPPCRRTGRRRTLGPPPQPDRTNTPCRADAPGRPARRRARGSPRRRSWPTRPCRRQGWPPSSRCD